MRCHVKQHSTGSIDFFGELTLNGERGSVRMDTAISVSVANWRCRQAYSRESRDAPQLRESRNAPDPSRLEVLIARDRAPPLLWML